MAKPVLVVPKSVKVAPRSSAVSPRKPLPSLPPTDRFAGVKAGMEAYLSQNKPIGAPSGAYSGPASGANGVPGAGGGSTGFGPPAPASGANGAESAGAPGATGGDVNKSPGYDPGVQARYDATRGGADLQYENATSGIGGERVGALAKYGYKASLDGEGNPTGQDQWTVDTGNPFSVAAMAKRAYDQRTSGNQIQYANRGQLYAGSLTNQQNATTFGYGQQDDAARKALSAVLSGLVSKKRTAETTKQIAYGDAAATRVQDQINAARGA
jgi:hypothetical protein